MNTVRKAFRLLRQFTVEEPELGVSEIARRLGLDRATVHRLLRAMVEERFVEQDAATRAYRLGLGVLDLAAVRVNQYGLLDVSMPHLDALRERTDETVALLVRDGCEVVCLAVLESRHAVRVGYNPGEHLPIHASAGGRVLLAHCDAKERQEIYAAGLRRFTTRTVTEPDALERLLDDVRRDEGSCVTDGYVEGVISAAAPVRDPRHRVVAAISIAAPLQRRNMEDLPVFFAAVRETGYAISLAWSGLGPRAISQRIIDPSTSPA